jgi:putative transposase
MKCYKQHIRKLSKDDFIVIKEYCQASNSLYNCCLYICKEFYKETNKYIGYSKLYHEIKSNEHYKKLPSKIAQQIVRLVDKDYRSFFALLTRKLKGQYNNDLSEPKFKKPRSEFILILPNDQVNIRKGKIKITKNLKIPFSKEIDGTIKQAIIKPKGNKYYEIHIAYEEKQKEQTKLNQDSILSIDLGLDNLCSCYSNVGRDFIITGKSLKSYNQFYNKIKASIQSELEIKNKKKWSNKINKLNINRSNWVDNYLNQTVNIIVKYCIENQISKVVCGYNEGWKQNSNMGKKTNQNFTGIPFFRLKQKLENKLLECGIQFILHEESYTSKCSALDKEEIKKHDKYLGKRIKRGLFKSSSGLKYNADINGAINIMRKVFPDENVFSKGIERCIVHPVMLNPLTNKA